MADAKYGRLFTEADLIWMIEAAYRRGLAEGKGEPDPYDGARIGDLHVTQFPEDEPLFLLRGQDKAAPGTIACYLPESRDAGASEEHIAAAHEAYKVMETWQAANRDRVKVPD